MSEPVQVLLLSGSTRAASANTAALRTARAVAPAGMTGVLYEGLSDLPAFNPDDDGTQPPAVAALRRQLAVADAVIFCTPEYAGTLPGSLKNLLDWTVGGGEPYGKPVAWINVAGPGRGEGAHATLAMVLGYVGAVVMESACARLPIRRDELSPDGLVADPSARARIAETWGEVVRYVHANKQNQRT